MFRQNVRADVLPLSEPLTLASGKVVTELPIPAGTKLYTSIGGYNMYVRLSVSVLVSSPLLPNVIV